MTLYVVKFYIIFSLVILTLSISSSTDSQKAMTMMHEDIVVGVHLLFSFLKSNTLCYICNSLVDKVERSNVPSELRPWVSYYFESLWKKGMYSTFSHSNEDIIKLSLDFFYDKYNHQKMNFMQNKFTMRSLCQSINLCESELSAKQITEYKSQINMIETNSLLNTLKHKTIPTKHHRIAVITDPHVDWDYKVNALLEPQGESILGCRVALLGETKKNITSIALSGKYHSPFKSCDISKALIEKALDSVFNQNVNVVLFLGDILPHDIKDMNEYLDNDKKIQWFFERMQFYRDKHAKQLIVAIGNHDISPIDQYYISKDENSSTFLSITNYNNLIKQLYKNNPNAHLETIDKGSYYWYEDQDYDYIALNTLIFSQLNFDTAFHVKNGLADDQLIWLSQCLALSKYNSRKVVILGHQPIYDWVYKYSQMYSAIIEDYHGIIVTQVFGHNHFKELRLLNTRSGIFNLISFPSLTSYDVKESMYSIMELEDTNLSNISYYKFNSDKEEYTYITNINDQLNININNIDETYAKIDKMHVDKDLFDNYYKWRSGYTISRTNKNYKYKQYLNYCKIFYFEYSGMDKCLKKYLDKDEDIIYLIKMMYNEYNFKEIEE